LHDDKTGLAVFGRDPNPIGPNELRLVEVTGKRQFSTKILKDKLSPAEVNTLIEQYSLPIDASQSWYASLQVACTLFDQARKQKKNLLFFIHGYNNDIKDVIKAANDLQDSYNVIAVPISWPANGGGKLSGTGAYFSDKDDARSSATAIHRAVEKIHFYHSALTRSQKTRVMKQANNRHPDNTERAKALFIRLLDKECDVSLNLLCHSMGNYLLKYATLPSGSSLRGLVFDNIGLVAADVNNPGHEQWLEKLSARNRIYAVINENDSALKWSRRKPGDEQLPRLGHYIRNLGASNTYYIDVTRSTGVRTEHSYYRSHTVNKNATLRRMFARIFEGKNAETSLNYRADTNVYRP
jgi:esterase/lipase superfamily enzyme